MMQLWVIDFRVLCSNPFWKQCTKYCPEAKAIKAVLDDYVTNPELDVLAALDEVMTLMVVWPGRRDRTKQRQ